MEQSISGVIGASLPARNYGKRAASFEAPGLSYPSAAMGAKPPGVGVGRDPSTGYHGVGSQSYGGWYEAERNYPPPPYPVQPFQAERSAVSTTMYTQRPILPTTTYTQWEASYGRVANTHLTSSTTTRPTESIAMAAIMPLSVNMDSGQPGTASGSVEKVGHRNQHLLCPVTGLQSRPEAEVGEDSHVTQNVSENVEVNVDVDVEAINGPS